MTKNNIKIRDLIRPKTNNLYSCGEKYVKNGIWFGWWFTPIENAASS